MRLRGIGVAAALAAACGVSHGDIYHDATFDLFNNGFDHLDIVSVEVTHDASNIYFDVTTRGNVSSPNWGKYCIAIDTAAGINDPGNGWARPISWNGQGIDYWIGSWADGPGFGGELRQMNGFGGNVLLAATYAGPGISGTSTSIQSFTVSRALMGLLGNQTFYFDVITTGGGNDPGVDHLSRADMATPDWSVHSVAGAFLPYTIPAPGAAALLGLAGLMAGRRRRA